VCDRLHRSAIPLSLDILDGFVYDAALHAMVHLAARKVAKVVSVVVRVTHAAADAAHRALVVGVAREEGHCVRELGLVRRTKASTRTFLSWEARTKGGRAACFKSGRGEMHRVGLTLCERKRERSERRRRA
jgi:hypothetical protein